VVQSDIAIGDRVITPNAAAREVWFAEITGDYRYESSPAAPVVL
jgi:predicted Mrr-cat superfamily restriction endonuclease